MKMSVDIEEVEAKVLELAVYVKEHYQEIAGVIYLNEKDAVKGVEDIIETFREGVRKLEVKIKC